MSKNSESKCARILPGSHDCENQSKKGHCSFSNAECECSGRTHSVGASVEMGRVFYEEHKKTETQPA